MEPRFLAVFALALLAFGAVSRIAERSPVTPPMVFIALGLALGAGGLGWMELAVDASVVHGLAELTLILVLFTDASRIDFARLRRERSIPIRMLAIGLPLTIALGALVARFVFPEMPLVTALLLAAILAPTDAALGQAVVSSPLVPVRIRQSLNVESGLNDGIALPAVLVLAALAGGAAGEGEARDTADWARFALLQVTLGPAAGVAVGFFGGRVLERARARQWTNEAFDQIAAIGLALLAFAGAELIHGNGFIAAFTAGLTLGNTARGLCACLAEFGEAEGQLLTLLVFLVFGAVMVPAAWPHLDGAAWLYAGASLTLVRMVPVALSLLGAGLKPESHAFLGWFGPRGLASILFVLLVVEEGSVHDGPMLEAVVTLTVLVSAFAHGITAYPLARAYSARLAAQAAHDAAEHEAVPEMAVRLRHDAAGTQR